MNDYGYGTATERRSEEADAAQSIDGQRSVQTVELRFVRQSWVPQSGLHSSDQCLCRSPHQTAFASLSQPVVHSGKFTHQVLYFFTFFFYEKSPFLVKILVFLSPNFGFKGQ